MLTRQFVSFISGLIENHGVDVFTLTDFDPDGIAIHLTYKYGSGAQTHSTLITSGAVHLGITSEIHAVWIRAQTYVSKPFPVATDDRLSESQ